MAAQRIEVIKNHLRGPIVVKPNSVTATKYEYTLENNIMTKEQRDFFEENGYLIVRKLISDELIEKCRNRFLDLCDGVADKGHMVMMKEIALMKMGYTGEHLYNKAQEIIHDKVFSQYTDHPKLLDYVQCFTGPNIMGMHNMLINKPPGTTPHPPHQDLYYFNFRPANRITGAWTAMEPVYKENGCLYVLPGSHKGQIYDHSFLTVNGKMNKAYYGVTEHERVVPEEKRVYLPMDTGDTIFFHPVLIHGSGPNLSNGFRKSLSCHYAASECHYTDITGTFTEKVAKEILDPLKANGHDLTYEEFWYYRGKCVRGQRINL